MHAPRLRHLAVIVLALGPALPSEEVHAGPPEGVIDLEAGGTLAGRLVRTPATGPTRPTLLFSSPLFADPFEFAIGRIGGIRFSPRAEPPAGEWILQLCGGDMLTGTITGIDQETVSFTVGPPSRPQPLRIARQVVERISRAADAGAGGYVGPIGLEGWSQVPPSSWRAEAGRLVASARGATVARDVAAPARAVYDVILSWRERPEFRIAVSAGADAAAAGDRGGADAYAIERIGEPVDSSALVLVRREQGAAAVEPLPVAMPAERRLRLVIFVDATKGRMAVVVPDANESGRPLADVTLPPEAGRKPGGWFRLTGMGDVCLESLRVVAWTTDEPTVQERDSAWVADRKGTLVEGTIDSLADGQIELRREAAGGARIALADIDTIAMPRADDATRRRREAGLEACTLRVTSLGGRSLAGELVRIDDEAVWLRRDGIDEPVGVPHDSLLAMESRRRDSGSEEPPGRLGALVLGSARMRGCLVPGPDDDLRWRPLGSLVAAPFVVADGTTGPDAVVEYVERTSAAVSQEEVGGIGGQVSLDPEGGFVIVMMREEGAAARDGRLQLGDRIDAIAPERGSRFVETKGLDTDTVMNLLRGRIGTPVRIRARPAEAGQPREVELVRGSLALRSSELLQSALETHARLAPEAPDPASRKGDFPSLLHLVSGDVVPCILVAATADDLTIRTPLARDEDRDSVVSTALVKAVELVPGVSIRSLERARFERLLTLPRSQRSDPPTHLVRLVDGDYIRGRVESIDADTVRVRILGTTKQLPRGQVARIIWLHPEPVDASDGKDDEKADTDAGTAAAGRPAGLTAQGVTDKGRRITLVVERLEDGSIVGRNAALGESRMEIRELDRLLLGAAIAKENAEGTFSQWRLRPATEPRALQPADDPKPNAATR